MLSCLEYMYHDLGLVKEFNMNPITLKRWLVNSESWTGNWTQLWLETFPLGHWENNRLPRFQLAIQENYRNNPFHNFRHCFCVSQMMYGMIHLCNLQVTHMFQVTGFVCARDGCRLTESYASNGRTALICLLKWQLSTFLSFIPFQGEADSHRHGDSDDSRRVSRPGPPWLQQHVRPPDSACKGVKRRRNADANWPQCVLTFTFRDSEKLPVNCESSSAQIELRYENRAISDDDSVRCERLRTPLIAGEWWEHKLVIIYSTACRPSDKVPNQRPHGAGGALQWHIAAGEPPLRCCLPDPVTSRMQHLCKRGSWSLQTDPTGEIREKESNLGVPMANNDHSIMGLFGFSHSGNNHPHPGHRHGQAWRDTRLLQAKSGQLWLHQRGACDMRMYTLCPSPISHFARTIGPRNWVTRVSSWRLNPTNWKLECVKSSVAGDIFICAVFL